jgi:hypothetical protein
MHAGAADWYCFEPFVLEFWVCFGFRASDFGFQTGAHRARMLRSVASKPDDLADKRRGFRSRSTPDFSAQFQEKWLYRMLHKPPISG